LGNQLHLNKAFYVINIKLNLIMDLRNELFFGAEPDLK